MISTETLKELVETNKLQEKLQYCNELYDKACSHKLICNYAGGGWNDYEFDVPPEEVITLLERLLNINTDKLQSLTSLAIKEGTNG